jgi:hypothetical protein
MSRIPIMMFYVFNKLINVNDETINEDIIIFLALIFFKSLNDERILNKIIIITHLQNWSKCFVNVTKQINDEKNLHIKMRNIKQDYE